MSKNTNYPIYNFNLIDGLYTNLIFNHNIERHCHIFWEITVSLKGEYVNHFDSGDMLLKACSLTIIRPSDIHYVNIKETSAVYRDIYVSDEKMRRFSEVIHEGLYDELLQSPTPITCVIDKAHMDSIEATATKITNLKGSLSKNEITILHNCLVSEALSAYAETRYYPGKQTPDWILDMLSKLNLHTSSELDPPISSLPDLIEQIGYSHGHICRKFKEYFGCTLIQYINRQKMAYSTTLLLNTNLSVSDIAQTLGYSNQSNYTNSFKKEYGMSPLNWRKNNLKLVHPADPPSDRNKDET